MYCMYGFSLISQIKIQIGGSLWKLFRTTLYLKQSLLYCYFRLLGALFSFENVVMGFLQLPRACLLMLNPFHYNKPFHSVQLGFFLMLQSDCCLLPFSWTPMTVWSIFAWCYSKLKLQCLCVNRSHQFCHFKLMIM